ncbi:MAG: PdxA family dehydrogenase [Planctomycetaceae bacterium]
MSLPSIALTMGDVAGIGPEVIVRAWQAPELHAACRPIVVGHPGVLKRAVQLVGVRFDVRPIDRIEDSQPSATTIPCWNPTGDQAADVPAGVVDDRAGQAACEYLSAAAQAALAGRIDGITTAPLSKAALHRAGLHYPGHTEILAEICSVRDYAMMLYLGGVRRGRESEDRGQRTEDSGRRTEISPLETSTQSATASPLGVVHVTLHVALRNVPGLLSTGGILEKIRLLDRFLRDFGGEPPRIGVCALNPHAGEDGLFGDEEVRFIAPAVVAGCAEGINAHGPYPADTLLKRAVAGEFDGVVAMYHDQGHIALKLIGWNRAVNVTLGLPIVRTSPSHGTAFDIAWQGKADAAGMLEAVLVAARLATLKLAREPA